MTRVSPPLLLQRRHIACFCSQSFGGWGAVGAEELKGFSFSCGEGYKSDASVLPDFPS